MFNSVNQLNERKKSIFLPDVHLYQFLLVPYIHEFFYLKGRRRYNLLFSNKINYHLVAMTSLEQRKSITIFKFIQISFSFDVDCFLAMSYPNKLPAFIWQGMLFIQSQTKLFIMVYNKFLVIKILLNSKC